MKFVMLSLFTLALAPATFAAEAKDHAKMDHQAHSETAAADAQGAFEAAPAGASVNFLEPKDGATVPKTFKVKMEVKGMKLHPKGALVKGTGHHHLIVDGKAGGVGEVIPADATHIHYGKGESEGELTLAPGKHTLTLDFADGAHRSYGPSMNKTITVTVK